MSLPSPVVGLSEVFFNMYIYIYFKNILIFPPSSEVQTADSSVLESCFPLPLQRPLQEHTDWLSHVFIWGLSLDFVLLGRDRIILH